MSLTEEDKNKMDKLVDRLNLPFATVKEEISTLKDGINLSAKHNNNKRMQSFIKYKKKKIKEIYASFPNETNYQNFSLYNLSFPTTYQKNLINTSWKDFLYEKIQQDMPYYEQQVIFKHLIYNFKPEDYDKLSLIPDELWHKKLTVGFQHHPITYILSKLENEDQKLNFSFEKSKNNRYTQKMVHSYFLRKDNLDNDLLFLDLYIQNSKEWKLNLEEILSARDYWIPPLKNIEDNPATQEKIESMNTKLAFLCLNAQKVGSIIKNKNTSQFDARYTSWMERLTIFNSSINSLQMFEEKFPQEYPTIMLFCLDKILKKKDNLKIIPEHKQKEQLSKVLAQWMYKNSISPDTLITMYLDNEEASNHLHPKLNLLQQADCIDFLNSLEKEILSLATIIKPKFNQKKL